MQSNLEDVLLESAIDLLEIEKNTIYDFTLWDAILWSYLRRVHSVDSKTIDKLK